MWKNESPLKAGITLECAMLVAADSSTQDSHKTRAADGKDTQELEHEVPD